MLLFLIISWFCIVFTQTNTALSSVDGPANSKRAFDLPEQPRPIELITILYIEPGAADGKNNEIKIRITNPYDKPVYLLKWNTVLETSLGVVSALSFATPTIEDVLAPVARYRTIINYRKASLSHLIRIDPEQTYTKSINIDEQFLIAKDTTAMLRLEETCRGFLFDGTVSLGPIARADVMRMPIIELKPPQISVALHNNVEVEKGASEGSKKRANILPGDFNSYACSGTMEAAVNLARIGANDLAESVRYDVDDTSWTTYMNGDLTVRQNVERTYANVEKYMGRQDFDVAEACQGSQPLSDQCSDYVASFSVHDFTEGLQNLATTIVFCNYFLTGLPPKRECEYPAANNDLEDQTGAFLHELTRSRLISASYDVRDGEKDAGGCFGWGCVILAAHYRDSRAGLPENIADAYELYAYARRAKRCEDEAERNKPPHPGIQFYCWLKTRCRNGANCVGQAINNAGLLIGNVAATIGTCGATEAHTLASR